MVSVGGCWSGLRAERVQRASGRTGLGSEPVTSRAIGPEPRLTGRVRGLRGPDLSSQRACRERWPPLPLYRRSLGAPLVSWRGAARRRDGGSLINSSALCMCQHPLQAGGDVRRDRKWREWRTGCLCGVSQTGVGQEDKEEKLMG